ncbi:MAG: amidohydrolase [Acidimicrobiaceae bacterium]|nr:amidohydrolase [Acidimicrobiaceae bacterium]
MARDRQAPDLVLRRGQIVTACGDKVVEAMAVRGNRVCAVGSGDQVTSLIGPSTDVVDLDGRTVVPGINDSHVHLGYFGAVRPPLAVDVGFPAVKSIADIADAIGSARAVNGWIRGNGWDIGYLEDAHPGRLPNCDDLDAVSPDAPVALRDFSGHQLWVNSRALELAGINEETPDPNDGVIVRDRRGRPTGLLREAASALIDRILPPLTDTEFDQALDTVKQIMHAQGITSVTDAALGPGGNAFEGGAAGERFLSRLAERAGGEDFALRTTVLLAFSPLTTSSLSDVSQHLDSFVPPPDKAGWFRVAGIKFFADGVPPNKTGWVSQQYAGGGCGCLTIAGDTDEERLADLETMINMAHRAGHQIGVHVTGDRAIEETVRCFVRAQRRSPRPDPRHYVIHADLASREVLNLLGLHGFGASMQPAIKWTIADLMTEMLGKERADYQWPLRSALDAGVRVTSSSDAPITFPSWRQGVETAVLRESKATGEVHGPDERITALEAIRTFTINGAWQDRADGWKGGLVPGMVADYYVLDDRLLDADPHEIAAMPIAATAVDGRLVFGDFPRSGVS